MLENPKTTPIFKIKNHQTMGIFCPQKKTSTSKIHNIGKIVIGIETYVSGLEKSIRNVYSVLRA